MLDEAANGGKLGGFAPQKSTVGIGFGFSTHNLLINPLSNKPSQRSSRSPMARKNISKIRDTSFHGLGPSDQVYYKPKVSENFLEDWLDFPIDRNVRVWWNMCKMWLSWLLWTNKAMAGLDPNDPSIRSRITQHISILGTAAGLFLVVAITAFLVPPTVHREEDHFWLNVFGVLTFTASCSLLYYIVIGLTVFYPLVESLRDDIAFDAYEQYQRRLGGYETYMFYIGIQLVACSLLVGAKIIYSDVAAVIMTIIFVILLVAVSNFSKEFFIALDPISAMHMGLSNDRDVQFRAELLSHFMLRKIPNSIMVDEDDEDPHKDVFEKRRESQKLQNARSSQKYGMTAGVSQHQQQYYNSLNTTGSMHNNKPFGSGANNPDDEVEMLPDEEDTNGEFLASGKFKPHSGKFKPVVRAAEVKKTICITRIPFVAPLVEDVSEKTVDGERDDREAFDFNNGDMGMGMHDVEDAPADNTMKKSIFTTENKLGAKTVFTSNGATSTIFTTRGAFKRGTMAVPFKTRVVPVVAAAPPPEIVEAPATRPTRRSFMQGMQGLTLGVGGAATNNHTRRSFMQNMNQNLGMQNLAQSSGGGGGGGGGSSTSTATTRRSFMQSMDLKEMFVGENSIFPAYGLRKADSNAAYNAIIKAGCTSTQDLLDYLNSHRNHVSCSCGKAKKGTSGRGMGFTHAADCDSRLAGVWADSLVKMNIPAFHAMKIIECLKKELK